MITIITPVKNAVATVHCLYRSLQKQSRKDFEWIVLDGGSNDGTLALLEQYSEDSSWIRLISGPDCGIYDAINKGIMLSSSEHYVVAGADDEFSETAVQDYQKVLESFEVDVILARVYRGRHVIGGFHPKRAWISHSKAFTGSHSVGMLFNKQLHKQYEMYSRRFRLLADGYFLKLLLRRSGSVKFYDAEFIAGRFGDTGRSSVGKLETLVETWQIQLLTERSPLLQTCIFLWKLLIRYRAVVDELKNNRSRMLDK